MTVRILLFALLFSINAPESSAQKLEKFVFNLYTDSLKKGFYNYINVDGLFSDGTWLPLDTTHILFSATGGSFKGNDLFIDSTFTADSVIVTATERNNRLAVKKAVIYIRKRGFDEPLEDESPLKGKRGSAGVAFPLSAMQASHPLQPRSFSWNPRGTWQDRGR
jgi:hypothetical protein